MPVLDISLDVSPDMVVWPGQPRVALERISRIADGGNSNVSRLEMSVHAGTHVDAPVHFVEGSTGVELLSLDVLVGQAYVLNLPRVAHITAAHLARAKVPARTQRLLIRTRNSRLWAERSAEFFKGYVAVHEDAARWIVDRGIKLVGVDYLSVAPWGNTRPTHQILLQAGVVVVEGLNLSQVKAGNHQFVCLPLKLLGSDGAPARAVLLD
jgi:arylformamidase